MGAVMKIKIFILFIILLQTSQFAQPMEVEWTKTYGGTGWDGDRQNDI